MIAYTKAAKRKAKRAKQANGINAEFNERWGGQDTMQAEPDDPLATVRQARSRQTGVPEDEALRPIFGEEAGRAIASVARANEADRLWRLFLAFDRADDLYFSRIIGRSRFPAVSKIEFMPERFGTRADDRPDLRTEDQKVNDTVKTWMRWQGHLGCLAAHERTAIIRASRQMDDLHKDGGPTLHGKAFVAALRVLAGVVDA